MSENGKLQSQQTSLLDDTISTEDDIPGSSISFSIRENSIQLKEKSKSKPEMEPEPPPKPSEKKDQWWLKKPTAQLDLGIGRSDSPLLSPGTSSSMKDFLDKESMCKKDEAESAKKDDTLHDILASVAFNKCQSDGSNATDEDIGSIIEEISKIAKTVTPVDSVKSKSVNGIMSEEEESVKELLEEAEKLVQKKGNNFMNQILNDDSKVIKPNNIGTSDGSNKVSKLEVDIIKIIEEQVCTKTDRKNLTTSIEEILENEIIQKRTSDDSVVNNNLDLDDLIEQNSVLRKKVKKKEKENKESSHKEMSDVEKDFFDALIEKTKENVDRLSSHSSSLDHEDFTHFLKLLQEQSNKEGDTISNTASLNLLEQFDPLKEKEVSSTESNKLADKVKNLPMRQSFSLDTLRLDNLPEESPRQESSRTSSSRSSKRSAKGSSLETKKIISGKDELYTVGLTPRLELFADNIPKLLAEKSNELMVKKDNEEKKTDDNEDFCFKNFKALDAYKHIGALNDHKNVSNYEDLIDFKDGQYIESSDFRICSSDMKKTVDLVKSVRVISAPEESRFLKSKSYDQLPKPANKRSNSLENIKNIKPAPEIKKMVVPNVIPRKNAVPPKLKTQTKPLTSKITPKTKFTSHKKKEPVTSNQEFSLDIRGSQIRLQDEIARNSLGGGDWVGVTGVASLESLYQDERRKFMQLKLELEAEIETYKTKLKNVQLDNEQETFSLKKQNIILKAKIDEMKKSVDVKAKYDPKHMSMQKELERQDNIIRTYEIENKKLIEETKRLQSESRNNAGSQKPRIISIETIGNDEKLKDLKEANVKLSLELSELRQKYNDFVLNNEDIVQQNSLLQEELAMIKDQLRSKNDFITDRLQSMTTNELDLRKEVEDVKVELHSKTEQLKHIKLDYERLQQSIDPVEKEILDLRARCSHYQEKLQTSKQNCEREKQLSQKLKDQVILDNKNIMDLNRQVREMERILKRKNPDSVSALILTANSENEKLNSEKVRLLEDRIVFLESEIKIREETAEVKLTEIQRKFTDMKDKYSSQVCELELRLRKTPPIVVEQKKAHSDSSTQTVQRLIEHRNSEPNLAEKKDNKSGPKSQNVKEDIHLLATIRGLKLELANKEKTMSRLSKDHQELQKTNRKLQKEREKLLNERRNLEKNKAMTSSDSKLASSKTTEADDVNSNFYHNGLGDRKLSASLHRLNEPVDTVDVSRMKKLISENQILKDELSRLNKDFVALKNKRLHDLNLLQEEHEKEIALIVKEYNVKSGDSKTLKLQGQVNSQIALIAHLKQQIDKLQDSKEQAIILKAERDHLEGKIRVLSDKVKYLSTPSTHQLQLLQEKISILQQRHETRELSLQKLVRDLLRSRGEEHNCNWSYHRSDKGQTQQLCQFRQELDNILGTLQNLTTP